MRLLLASARVVLLLLAAVLAWKALFGNKIDHDPCDNSSSLPFSCLSNNRTRVHPTDVEPGDVRNDNKVDTSAALPNHLLSRTPGPFIVEVENVWKIYRTGSVTVEALRGISMGVNKGEMVAVMGPSGCGKTTLLNCVSGLDDLSKGKVTIEGVDLAKMSDDQKSEFRARRMGFIFQAYNLLPVLTAQENIELPLLLGGVSESEAHVAAVDALKMVGLAEWKSHKPMELSGGQQQRVTIARALVNKPAIVWADEPTGNLDSENSQEIIKLLRSLNQQYGLTVVLVSHDSSIAYQTDRIIHMRNGQIEKEIKPEIVAS